jgi:hypothetical protein
MAARKILRRYEKMGSYFCDECARDIVKGKSEMTHNQRNYKTHFPIVRKHNMTP